MLLEIVWSAMIAGLFFSERHHSYFYFPLAGFAFIAAVLLFFDGDALRASLLAGLLIATIVIVSLAKYRLTGSGLIADDITLLVRSRALPLFRSYPREIAMAALFLAGLVAAVTAIAAGIDD